MFRKLLKVFSVFLLIMLATANLFAQEQGPAKFALVIGNANYTGLSPLANPVNDANDVSAILQHLGFTVDKILNGNRVQMEDAVVRLKNRLSNADNAYGFFFYAGHGVQSGGENFLIPVNANIPSENFLRDRAVSVQSLLDELNDAGNTLNVVVLDACRDNPFGWSRSGTRGLSIVTRQPAESIIVYATSAGQQASDGVGRNGLFTSQLINNLAVPGIEVKEVFNRTGNDVARVSGNNQIPAIYSQFFGTAFLGAPPADWDPNKTLGPTTVIIGGRARQPEKFWSVGASAGTSFIYPWLVGTVQGTIAPFKNSFLEVGLDIGFISGTPGVGYNSFCPFIHAAFYLPVTEKIGGYAGAGGSYTMANYDFGGNVHSENCFALDVIAGLYFFDMIHISYNLRTEFKNISNKLSVGYVFRF